jgi:hypothetical protein
LIDSFSGPASDLHGRNRTADNVLAALRKHPRVSTWDMSEHVWLRNAIGELERAGRVVEDKKEPYPWHRFNITKEAP